MPMITRNQTRINLLNKDKPFTKPIITPIEVPPNHTTMSITQIQNSLEVPPNHIQHIIKDLCKPTTDQITFDFKEDVIDTETFIDFWKKKLLEINKVLGRENKIRISLELFTFNNKYLPHFVNLNLDVYFTLVCSSFNKSVEFIDNYLNGDWDAFDKKLVRNFYNQLLKMRAYSFGVIQQKKYSSLKNDEKYLINDLDAIDLNTRNTRPKIQTSYAEMDIIYDDYKKDPDYLPYKK
jgi:hypothetical protein